MKFFLPYARDEAVAEHTLAAIRRFAQDITGWQVLDRRIYRLRFTHNGKEHSAEVGKVFSPFGEEVIAILDSNTYLICTPNQGVIRGFPFLVGKGEIWELEEFEP